jgi:uncharacterized Zn finger protein (UPF0148 family)
MTTETPELALGSCPHCGEPVEREVMDFVCSGCGAVTRFATVRDAVQAEEFWNAREDARRSAASAEPAAWQRKIKAANADWKWVQIDSRPEERAEWVRLGYEIRPLYASPPPSPVVSEEITAGLCPRCAGTGKDGRIACWKCSGQGAVIVRSLPVSRQETKP